MIKQKKPHNTNVDGIDYRQKKLMKEQNQSFLFNTETLKHISDVYRQNYGMGRKYRCHNNRRAGRNVCYVE
jgi:hypothetical protein